MVRLVVAFLVAVSLPIGAEAQTANEDPGRAIGTAPHRRSRRDRWRNTISLGFTMGGGSPLGALGTFLEYRPIRWASLSVGGGFGGTFGPAVGGSVYVDPLVVGAWGLGVGASISHNFSWRAGQMVPGRPPLPAGTQWVSVELQAQFRPSRGIFLRLGVGRAFLLDTASFDLASEQELDSVNLPRFPVASPVDAMYSAARHEDLAIWYVHLDVAPTWRL